MNQLSEILEEKGHEVLRIEADASVFEAVKRMVEDLPTSARAMPPLWQYFSRLLKRR